MKVRWYSGYQTNGHPKDLTEQLSRYSKRKKLTEWLRTLCFEKSSGRGEFYFFIGMDTDEWGTMPEPLQDALEEFRYCSNPVNEPQTLEQIKTFVSGQLEVEHFGGKIGLHTLLEMGILEDPLDFSKLDEMPRDHVPDPAWNKMLYWLSSVGTGSWETFARACTVLGFSSAKSVLRQLKLLGHLESSHQTNRWMINPAHAVQISDREWVLCGQRSPQMLDTLEVTQSAQGRWSVTTLEGFEGQDAEWSLGRFLEILPNIDTWRRSLYSPKGIDSYKLKRYEQGDFRPYTKSLEQGFYQIFGKQETEPRYTLFWDREIGGWRQGDWYGLRFLSYEQPWIHYDPHSQKLAVLAEQRFPEIYERALVLASGYLPQWLEGYLVYSNISQENVCHLAKLLKLEIKENEANYV
jgi:hypothetical protein